MPALDDTQAMKPISRDELHTRLRVRHVAVWPAMLNSLFLALLLAVVVEIMVYAGWQILNSADIFTKFVQALTPTGGPGAATLQSWLTLHRFLLFGGAVGISLLIIVPALTLIVVTGYNVVARLTGGVRLTLAQWAQVG